MLDQNMVGINIGGNIIIFILFYQNMLVGINIGGIFLFYFNKIGLLVVLLLLIYVIMLIKKRLVSCTPFVNLCICNIAVCLLKMCW